MVNKKKLNLGALLLASGLALSPQISNADDITITGGTQFTNIYDNISLGGERPLTYIVNLKKDLLIVDSHVKGINPITLSYSGFKKDVFASLGVTATKVKESKRFSPYNLGVSAGNLTRMFGADPLISNEVLTLVTRNLAEKFVEADYISRNFLTKSKTWDKRFLVDPKLTDFDKNGRSNLGRNHQFTNPKKNSKYTSLGYEKFKGNRVSKPSSLIVDYRAKTTQTTLEKLMKFQNMVLRNRAGHSAVSMHYDEAAANQFERAKNSIGGNGLNSTFQNGRETTKGLIETALRNNPNDRLAAVEEGFKNAVLIDKAIYANSKQMGGQN